MMTSINPSAGNATPRGRQPRAGKPDLGTNAKSSPPPSLKARRAIRYQALTAARMWATARAGAPSKANPYPLNKYRVSKCMYVNHGDVGVMRSIAHGTSHYKGLTTCGSVWACPVCAAKIQERRRAEIVKAIDWAKQVGLTPVMVTFTFPHQSFHRLSDMLARQADAFKMLRKGRSWDKLKESIGYAGLIRSLEVTHGENGWHPHTHELWFLKTPEALSGARLTVLWGNACRKAGLLTEDPVQLAAFNRHSVDVRIADDTASEYLAKQDNSRAWGVADEIAKATSKAGRKSGVHPHHFLVRHAEGDRELYIEYIEAMKGKRQIFWSRGLKANVGVDDVSDEEIAESTEDAADLLGLLSPDDWKIIRGNDARAEVLDAAEKGGWKAVEALLSALRPDHGTVG